MRLRELVVAAGFLGASLSLWISPQAPHLRNLRSRNSSSLDRTDSGAHHVILEPPLDFRQISARLSHAPVSAGGLLWVTARPNINVLSRSGSNQFDCPANIRHLDASPWWYGGGLRFVVLLQAGALFLKLRRAARSSLAVGPVGAAVVTPINCRHYVATSSGFAPVLSMS